MTPMAPSTGSVTPSMVLPIDENGLAPMIAFRGVLASIAFVSLGLPDGLLGVAWLLVRTP